MVRPCLRSVLVSVCFVLIAHSAFAAEHKHPTARHLKAVAAASPRLIIQITVDQLRGDLPFRYEDRFVEGGFRYFLDHGTWYADAQHPHADTETIVGHTTLATGAYPSRHGMVANEWFDRKSGTLIKNIRDPRYPVLPVNGENQSGDGVSPTAILTTTFSDELTLTTAGRARIFAISGKDRGAVPMAGHSGKALWYSESNGCYVSSSFYYTAYPAWVTQWCNKHPADVYRDATWNLLLDRSTYLFRDDTNQYPAGTPPEENMRLLEQIGIGRTFPHRVPSGGAFYQNLTLAPYADQLTLDFAKELITQEHLGEDDVPDYLGISFSTNDYIGHWFGPSSLENEDNLLRLDRTLRDLFAFVDSKVGLANTLIVISGDHGGPEYPELLARYGIDTGRVRASAIRGAVDQALALRFGVNNGLIANYSQPYFYIDHAALSTLNAHQSDVERVIADAAMQVEGVALAIPMTTTRGGAVETDEERIAQIRRNDFPERSGDVFIVQEAQWQVDGEPGRGPMLLQHGAPWAYDTFVPVAFAGGAVPAAMIDRRISTVDVAVTLAAILHTRFPSGSVGEPLVEVTRGRAAVNP